MEKGTDLVRFLKSMYKDILPKLCSSFDKEMFEKKAND
jgi:hypothetical protein